jgi:hypothetical protein
MMLTKRSKLYESYVSNYIERFKSKKKKLKKCKLTHNEKKQIRMIHSYNSYFNCPKQDMDNEDDSYSIEECKILKNDIDRIHKENMKKYKKNKCHIPEIITNWDNYIHKKKDDNEPNDDDTGVFADDD